MVEVDQCLEQEIWVAAGHPLVEMHVADWAKAQREDPMLSTVLYWLKAQKQTNLKMLLAEHTSSEEGKPDLTELAEFFAQRWNGRSPVLHGPQGTPCSCSEWVPLRCRSSMVWLYSVLAVEMFLVAGNDWSSTEIPEVLFTLLAAWGHVIYGTPTPNCVYCFNGSLTCRLY